MSEPLFAAQFERPMWQVRSCAAGRLVACLSAIAVLTAALAGCLPTSTPSPALGPDSVTGLDFRGNASTAGTVRFRFSKPLAMYPATYIWRVNPRRQKGYYTAFFWGNDGTFFWDDGQIGSYYGAHPYPQPPRTGTDHKWEISVNGRDTLSPEFVVYDQWYTQVLRVWSDGLGKHHEYFWDWPNTARVIRQDEDPSYGERPPTRPALTWGDAPWAPSEEIMNGVIRGIQIYADVLSVSDVAAEIASPKSTTAGAQSIWYLNRNPRPNDISDKSGAGNEPVWVGRERPRLWVAPP